MGLFGKASCWALIAVLAGIGGVGPQASDSKAAAEDSGFTLRESTPSPQFEQRADGTTTIRIEGFATQERRPGAPDVPTKTVLIAIPDGAVPRLEIGPSTEVAHPGLIPRPVPRSVAYLDAEDEKSRFTRSGTKQFAARRQVHRRDHYLPDSRYYDGPAKFPERVAWLGKIGTLRRQRYVELHLAPVRFDPIARAVLVRGDVEVTVRFDGAPATTRDPTDEGAFERVYRGAFANYEQGRRFRLDGSESAVAPTPAGEAQERGLPTPRRRILVSATGVVRLDYDRLVATDFPGHDISTWKLTNRGVSVPLRIEDDGDDVLEMGEWVEFYGQALDDEPKTEINTDFPDTDSDLYEARDFTDVNTYFLTVDTTQPAMTERDATPQFLLTPPADFEASARLEVDNVFLPLGGADPWYWLPVLNANSMTTSREVDLPLPGLTSGSANARVRVQLRGFTNFAAGDPIVDQTHLPRATLMNSTSDVLAFDDGSFQGRSVFLHDFNWTYPGAGPQLSDPARLRLELFSVPGIDTNEGIADWFEILYRRSFSAIGDLLVFDWPDEDAEFVVDGLTDSSAEIYEIVPAPGEAVVQAVRLTGSSISCGGTCSVRFRIDDLGSAEPRRFVVFGGSVPSVPADPDFTADTISDLRSNAQQADLVVIAHEELLDDLPGSPLSLLLAHRATAAGGALSSRIARLQDVYDEFNDGLPGPLALKEFLRWIGSSAPGEGWLDPKPTHVMLIGEGSVDYKGGAAADNYVPTQIMFKDVLELGFYASDTRIADFVGDDQLADMFIGRIPVRTVGEANLVLQKTLDYEQSAPAGSWTENSLFVSDRGKTGNNPAEALDFELTNAIAAAFIPSPYTHQSLRYWTDYYNNLDYLNDPNEPAPEEGIRRDIKAAINGSDCDSEGAAVTQYDGHGNAQVWSDDAFWDERFLPTDSGDLCNGPRPTWLIALNCLTGAFHVGAFRTVGEDWLKRDGGGAIAIFSPTGLSFNFISRAVTQIVWDDMFGVHKERDVGVTVMNSLVQLCANGSIEACQNHIYLGDPALKLALRAVAPATALQATASNAQVDLSWTASTTAGATYEVYRTESLVVPFYTRRNAAPLAGTAFNDTGVSNATTYYYYLVASDPDGFVSRFSNFNSDCATDGPDCVKATPLNPNPPNPPANLVVHDPGVGTQLVLSWDVSPEGDLSQYTIFWGTESGVYTEQATVGLVTSFTMRDLVEGQVYHAAMTATNTSNLTSSPSNEVSDFPLLAPGLHPPAFIDDLVVEAIDDDIRLTWSEVGVDVFGKPKTVLKYEIYRAISPGFENETLGAPIAECPSPCSGHLDLDAMLDGNSYRYRVRAVDAEGTAGGLGAELPTWTTLLLGWAEMPLGEIVLSWSPVTTRLDGEPVALQHYEIYADDLPFTRADIRDGLIPILATEAGTSLQIAPAGNDRYYSVLALDTLGNRSPF